MGSQVSLPVERAGLGVVPGLRGTSSWAPPTSLASSLEVVSPQLLGGCRGLFAASSGPCPLTIVRAPSVSWAPPFGTRGGGNFLARADERVRAVILAWGHNRTLEGPSWC